MKSLLTLLLAVTVNISFTLGQTSTSGLSSTVSSASRTTMTTRTSTASSSTGSATHTVTVGLDHKYSPNSVIADPGDIVRFIFYPQNHSVVRAEFKQPCIPYNLVHQGEHLFFSGNMESTTNDRRPTWDLRVNDTEPQFFYCSAPGSCIEYKMIGVINPSGELPFEDHLAAADDIEFQLSPGEEIPAEGTITTLPPGQATPTGSSGGNGNSNGGGGGSSLSAGAIAGIAIGGAAVVLLAIALIYLCGRRGGIEKGYRRSGMAQQPPPAPIVEANYRAGTGAGAGGPKSPPLSPYQYHHDPNRDTFRSSSPGQWSSQVGSPHSSYMGQMSPPMAMQGFGPQAPLMTGQEYQHQQQHPPFYSETPKPPEVPEQPPAELPGNFEAPNRPPHHPY